MTIRTMCDICKKVVAYTDPRVQELQAIENPGQFCEGHSQAPTKTARKEMMKSIRGKGKDNSFFISRETGEIVSSAWRDDKGHFPQTPEGTYEVHVERAPFETYSDLDAFLDSVMCRVYEEDNMVSESEKQYLKDVISISEEQANQEYGLKADQIEKIRDRAKELGIV
ncbi:MAG TPA: hypothetical protein VN455_05615 [Methanotrichaceae archaeon]|nr:hypothetical protein [Methanotrichaceae archaeon]